MPFTHAQPEDVPALPAEFADQIAEARFVEEAERQGLEDARFVDDGEFFKVVGFCVEPAARCSA